MKRINGKAAVLYCFLIICLLFSAGCDKYTRYNVLTVFFTGVPHPDEPKKDKAQRRSDLKDLAALRKEKERERLKAIKPTFIHGPYASGQCYHCHSTESSIRLRPSGDKTEVKQSVPTFEGGLPGRLVLPLKELCIACHTSKSVSEAYKKDLWIHGPVSDGLCTACHSAHLSEYPYMLLTEKSVNMCSKCHAKGFILETEDHKQEKECTSCHNPHFGKDRFLLKKDFNE